MDALIKILGASAERAPWGWGVLIVIVGALIKVWPIIQLQVIEAKAKVRGERKTALDDCQVRLAAMDLRLDRAEEKSHQFELRLVAAINAYRILDIEVAANNPTSIGLAQARVMMQTAFAVTEPTPPDITEVLASVS